ncbi:MAG: hypothetical protein IT555_08255 [Acetobacteraceae bacterium]|nr:hypothetical protein [Acetobacteraceae bacterium]
MSSGELLYLALVFVTFGGFGLVLAYNTWRYDRIRGGRPETLRYEDAQH